MDEKFYTQALKFLSRRPRSEKEVVDNLLKKKAPQEQITILINLLKQQKFLDDKAFSKWWVEQRANFKPKGWYALQQELKRKGIPDKIIKEVEEEVKTGVMELKSEFEQALEIAQKRAKRLGEVSKEETYQKIGGLLSRRGFNLDTIKAVIDQILHT